MYYALPLALLSLASTAVAAPAASYGNGNYITITTDQLLKVAPNSKACDGSSKECRTAEIATRPINHSFMMYKIASKGQAAAALAMMAFESVEFKFETNQSGNPGQGTANMQNTPFNVKYGMTYPGKAPKIAAIVKGADPSTLSPDQANAVRDLLVGEGNDRYNFGSGAWFTTQCSPEITQGLVAGTQEGWENYVKTCVGTDPGPRQKYYDSARAALGM